MHRKLCRFFAIENNVYSSNRFYFLQHAKSPKLRLSIADKTWRVNGSGNVTEYHVVVAAINVYSVAYLMF